MLFRGWGIQNRHTLMSGNKLLLYSGLSPKLATAEFISLDGSPITKQVGELPGLPENLHAKIDLFRPACSSGHRESKRSAPGGTRRSASP